MLKLYDYFRSSASYRVRIALHLKNLSYDKIPINLIKDGGEQHSTDFKNINPQQLVPVLVNDETRINQSLAIIEYLEELHPEPPLLPQDPAAKAFVRSLALMISSDIHPLNNLRVINYLTQHFAMTSEQKNAWYQHWIHVGLLALETKLKASSYPNAFCFGDTPTLADICLIPQLYNARRFACDLSKYPSLCRIEENCLQLDAFAKAAPIEQAT